MDYDSVNFRKLLAAYAAGDVEYPAFRQEALEFYQKAVASSDGELLRICRAAEWEMAEYSEDLILEPELKTRLSSLTRAQLVVHVGGESSAVITGTSSAPQEAAGIVVVAQPLDVLPALVYA